MKWGKRRLNPDKLWIHYGIAICTIVGLLVSIFFVSQTLVQHSKLATHAVDTSRQLTTLSQQILLLSADGPDSGLSGFDQLQELSRQLDEKHMSLMKGDIWSDALRAHYFSGALPLSNQVRQFVDLAERLTELSPEERQTANARMLEIYGPEGLAGALETASALYEDAADEETARLKWILQLIIAISAAALLAEALFIFLPAQLMVKSVIGELKNKTDVLCDSQQQLQQMNDRLHHLVNHDPLTGLPNRAYVTSYITELSGKDQAMEVGILFVGLDGFKTINDTIGHERADRLLIAVGDRLQNCVDDDDIVARVGGDEFLLTTTEPPEVLAERIIASLGDPFVIERRNVTVGTSIGYLTAREGNYNPDQILGNAGIALQAAKTAGGRRAAPFSQSLRDEFATLQQLQLELRDAIQEGQIEPWFQPQINLADGSLRGAEVLARWRHPARGLLTPDKFLPAAERAGLITELDHAVWRAALEQASDWQNEGIWYPTISLNAAPDTISDPYLIERLLKQMHQAALGLDQIIIEVLETTLIEGSDDMAAINIDGLAECGITLELDDFGTGYASLSRLTQLPLSGIKLDRSLIAPLPDAGADSVVRAILALASELGLQVVAEGIEETEQADHLHSSGCAIGQGYGFARPMPAKDFDDWLRTHANITPVTGVTSHQIALRA